MNNKIYTYTMIASSVLGLGISISMCFVQAKIIGKEVGKEVRKIKEEENSSSSK